MIEFLIDGGGFVAVNPDHIVYLKNDSGQALVHMVNGNVFLPQLSYDDLLDHFQRNGVVVHLDKETRDDLEDTFDGDKDEDEE